MPPLIVFEPIRTVELEKFLPELRFEFPDLPEQLFKYALLRAARTAAHEGNLIRRKAIINSQRGVTRYALHSPDGMEICAILGIRHSSCCETRYMPRSFDPPENSCLCYREMAWYDDKEGVLHVVAACTPGTFYVSYAVAPKDDACTLPVEFYDDYLDILISGAKARIYRMGNKSWTNFQLADGYEKDFFQAINAAAVEAHTHKMRGRIKMNFGRTL